MKGMLRFVKKMPKKGMYEPEKVKVSDLIEANQSGILNFYEKNRGTRDPSELIVSEKAYQDMVKNGFTSIRFGTIVICLTNEGVVVIADGHSRFKGLVDYLSLLADEDEQLHADILETEVVVNFCHIDDFSDAYVYIGRAARHSGRQKVTNTDFAAGYTVQKILNNIKADLPENLWQPFFHIVYAYNEHNKRLEGEFNVEFDFNEIKRLTRKAEELKDIPYDQYKNKLTSKTTEEISAALSFYLELLEYIEEEESKELFEECRKAGAMTFFVLTYLTKRQYLFQTNEKLVAKMEKNIFNVSNLISEISRRNKGKNAVIHLMDLIAPNKGDIKEYEKVAKKQEIIS